MFTTERLRLRAYQTSDHANLLAVYNNAAVMEYFMEDYIVPRDSKFIDDLLEKHQKAVMICIVETLDEAEFVGFAAISPMPITKNRNAVFGIAILPKFWNKGFGSEITKFMVDHAFRYLAMHRVTLTTLADNSRAIAVYKKIGFVEEGRQRKVLWVDGEWRDLLFMGILEEDWMAARNKAKEADSVVA